VAVATPEHPNLPRKGALALMFAAIVCAGVLGGVIGYGLVTTTCADTPNRAERLLEQVPGYEPSVASCTVPELLAAAAGTVVTAIGAGVVAILVLRAQSEWRGHAPQRPRR
jgi:ABC-type Fe3+ transport system permease subunit